MPSWRNHHTVFVTRGCIGYPHLKRAEVLFGRSKIYGFHSMVGPCAPVIGGIPSGYFGGHWGDEMLYEVV